MYGKGTAFESAKEGFREGFITVELRISKCLSKQSLS